MKAVSILLKPASDACNLACRYCFYKDVAGTRAAAHRGIMKIETAKRIFLNMHPLFQTGDTLTIGFQGGEPLLVGLDFFRQLVPFLKELFKDINLHFSLQTNATQLDAAWAAFFREEDFLIGVSLDLLPDVHDAYRKTAAGGPTFPRVMEAIRLLRENQVQFNILAVLTEALAKEPDAVYDALVRHDFRFIQFIPCLAPFASVQPPWSTATPKSAPKQWEGAAEVDPYAVHARTFRTFHQQLVKRWLTELKEHKILRAINLIDDYYRRLWSGAVTACGIDGSCTMQTVIEADGTVYPCDFYATDAWALGNLCEKTLPVIGENPRIFEFLSWNQESLAVCEACPYLMLCGGGCKRVRSQLAQNPCAIRGIYDTLVQNEGEVQAALAGVKGGES